MSAEGGVPSDSATQGSEASVPSLQASPSQPRDDLVKTAVQFLQTKKIQNTPLELRVQFLKKKGLTDEEIDLSLTKAGVSSTNVQHQLVPAVNAVYPAGPPPPHPPYMYPGPYMYPPMTRWDRFRDLTNSVVVLGALGYAAYWAFKKFVLPYLYGYPPKRKSLDDRITELDHAIISCITEIRSNMKKIEEDLDRKTDTRGEFMANQITDIKTEISSLKKLLLNRKQFPTATVTGPLAIPSWQQIAQGEGEEEKEPEAEEEGTGSGTNGSDSSLEMIKE